MTQLSNCPVGFEDGHVVGYRSDDGCLYVSFEFWNERRGTLVFEGLVGMHDEGAVGVTVGSVCEVSSSEFLASLVRRHFEIPPETTGWRHFRFSDLDDEAMLEVVARSCRCELA